MDINIQEIAKEIKERKKQLGESAPVKGDRFLVGLMESLNTGRETPSVNKIKENVDKSIEIHNKKHGTALSPVFKGQTGSVVPKDGSIMNEGGREEGYFKQFNNRSLGGREQSVPVRTLSEELYPKSSINETALINIMDRYMNENYGPVIERSIRNVMFESYSTDRIKNVMLENKGFIKEIVVEIIRELQKNKKQT